MNRFVFILLAILAPFASAQPVYEQQETRYCGQPERYADGSIKRKYSVRSAFARLHPCPSTGLSITSCPGWQIDHVIPLASCGCDAVRNMQWLPVEIKTCAGAVCKDRWERKVYQCQ